MAIHGSPSQDLAPLNLPGKPPKRWIPIFAMAAMVFLSAGLSYAYLQQGAALQEANHQVASLKGELTGYRQVAADVEHLNDMFSSFQEDGKTVPFTKFVASQEARVKGLEKTVQEITVNDGKTIAGLNTTVSSLESKSTAAGKTLATLEPKVTAAQTQLQELQDHLPAQIRTQVEATVADTRRQLSDRIDQQRESLNQLEQSTRDIADLERRLSAVEKQVELKATREDLNTGLKDLRDDLKAKASLEDLNAGLAELGNQYDKLEKRISALEGRATTSVNLREGQEGTIPGVGLRVKLQRLDKTEVIPVLVSAPGSEPLQLRVRLGSEQTFEYQGRQYKITVTRYLKLVGPLSDFLQVFIEAV